MSQVFHVFILIASSLSPPPVLFRTLSIGVPTIAAINGHAVCGSNLLIFLYFSYSFSECLQIAAGAMIAFCCDYRIMNSDKGFICINEVELGFPLTPGTKMVEKKFLNS